MGSSSPPAVCCKAWVLGEALSPWDLEAPSSTRGHLGALWAGVRLGADLSRVGPQPGRRSRLALSSRLLDMASTFRKPPGSETFCVSFLQPRGAWSASELRVAGLRHGHRRALQHVGAGLAAGVGASGGGRSRTAQVPFLQRSKLAPSLGE